MMKQLKRFSISPVSAAVALALGTAIPSAFAAGMPGLGTVTVGTVTASAGTTLGGAAGTPVTGTTITGLASGATLTVTGNSVVQWGGNTKVTDTNPAGFNLSSGSVLTVTGAAAGTALLNVDASGNPSVIAGLLQSTGANATNLFIANANGITVTSTGTIAAPYIGLIGADLSVSNVLGVPTAGAGSAQATFGTGGIVPVTFANGNGSIAVQGALVGSAAALPTVNPATGMLIAGSGSVNVDFTKVQAANNSVTVLGGVSAGVTAAGVVSYGGTNYGYGSATAAAPGYFATNVALNNASAAVVYTGAYGNLAFTGNSLLSPTTDWKGVLSNTGSLQLFNNTLEGQGTSTFSNRWYDTPNATATGYVQGAVGSFVNSGTLTSGGVGLFADVNGFTNTGTINLQAGTGNALVIASNTGDINLGGTVQTNNSQAAIKLASLTTVKSGNINVSAPLTIGNSGTSNGAYFYASANTVGNVNITGAIAVTNSAANSTGANDYELYGNNITVGANQTVSNSNGTTSKQPLAELVLNDTTAPGTVTVSAGSTLSAGDVSVFGASMPMVNLVADGNITATNTTNVDPTYHGTFNFAGNNISGAGNGTITAQEFNLDFLGNIRKSTANLTNNYWTNGLVLTSAGASPTLNLYAEGSSRQFVNLRVSGNITANSGTPRGAYFTSPYLSGTSGAGDFNANRLSQIMLMSTGNITLGGGGNTDPNGLGVAGGYFFFPGLSYFGTIPSLSNPNAIGSGSITAVGDVNNSVAIPVSGGQGLYFMTDNLTVGGSLFTNMNSYVNYGATTTQYNGVTYAVQMSPSTISNTLNMAPAANIGHVYTIPTSF